MSYMHHYECHITPQPIYLLLTIIINSQMAYFQRNHRPSGDPYRSNHHQQSLSGQKNETAEFKKGSESKQSYLKAFKKYYIEKLLDKKVPYNEAPLHNDKENMDIHKTRSQYQKEPSHHKSTKSAEKTSVMTECTRKSKEKYTPGKISRSKIVNLVNSNDSELQEMLYSSITEMEREMMTFGDLNDLTRENKLLKCSISKLKQILKDKLQVALKKNKEQLTIMFDQYSNMIKKLLQDKEILTNQLQATKQRCANEQRKVKMLEQSYENQIRIITEQNTAQINNTKQQVEQFLEMIIQYQEQANHDKAETQKLKQKLVQLEMENDQLRNQCQTHRNSVGGQQISFNGQNEQLVQKYALKIESLLTMMQQLQNQNDQLNQFLKSCKCSRIQNQSNKDSKQTLPQTETIEQVKKKYQKQLVQIQRQYIKQEMMHREVLKKKDSCIDRLNLVIQQLRKARYASVDKMTDDAFMNKLIQQQQK